MKALVDGTKLLAVGNISRTDVNFVKELGKNKIYYSGCELVEVKLEDENIDVKAYEYDDVLCDLVLIPQTKLTKNQFIDRFTGDEFLTITKLSSEDGNVAKFMFQIQTANYIDLQDDGLLNGLAYLIQKGLLLEERVSEILGR